MFQNNFELTINTPVQKVWEAITTPKIIDTWMQNTKVETDWQEGSKIVYTCYNESGEVMEWEGKKMIWVGKIEKMVENQEFTCSYDEKSTDLIKESYFLKSLGDSSTKLEFHQQMVSQQAADGYKEGMSEVLEMLKNFLESEETQEN